MRAVVLIMFFLFPSILLFSNARSKQDRELIEAISRNSGYVVQSDQETLDASGTIYKFIFQHNGENWFYIYPAKQFSREEIRIKLKSAGISEIHDDEIIYAQSVPDDPMFEQQWGMKLIDLDKVSTEYQNTWHRKAKMYICDSGPPADLNGRITHEDLITPLNNRFIVGNNYAMVYNISAENDTFLIPAVNRNWDDIGHSTHIAGIAAAMSNNGIGVAGVDWVSELTFEKILRDGSGWGFVSWMMLSLMAADTESEERQMDIVVNISAGGIVPYRPLEKLIGYLDEKRNAAGYGVLLVCSGGNHASEALLFPAAYSHWGTINTTGYENVISVGAVTLDTLDNIRRASYSSYGDFIDIWAPGGSSSEVIYINETYRVLWDPKSIWSLAPDSAEGRPFYPHWYNAEDYPYKYFRLAGTSMAAPHITGAVCRLLDLAGSAGHFISAKEIKEELKRTGTVFQYKGLIEDKYGKKTERGDEFVGYVLNLKRFWEQNFTLAATAENRNLINTFEVQQNFPNPFNAGTRIQYYIPEQSVVRFAVFNILGEMVISFESGSQSPGSHTIDLDASSMSSGTYFYKLSTLNQNIIKKMQLIK